MTFDRFSSIVFRSSIIFISIFAAIILVTPASLDNWFLDRAEDMFAFANRNNGGNWWTAAIVFICGNIIIDKNIKIASHRYFLQGVMMEISFLVLFSLIALEFFGPTCKERSVFFPFIIVGIIFIVMTFVFLVIAPPSLAFLTASQNAIGKKVSQFIKENE